MPQNNITELWAILHFIEPQKFVSLEHFLAQFGELQTAEQVKDLHAVLHPHLLRRLKEDVEKSIPPKEETLVNVELTIVQKQYYRAILDQCVQPASVRALTAGFFFVAIEVFLTRAAKAPTCPT